MKTILVDMDGVLVDFEKGLRDEWNNPLNHVGSKPYLPLVFKTHDFIGSAEDHWKLEGAHRQIAEFHSNKIRKIYNKPGFFLNLPPIEGAFEGWERIKDLGFHPVVCSKPVKSATCQHEKRQWIRQYLGSKVADEAYIIQDKGLAHGAVLIDDRPNLTTYALQRKETLPKWKHCLYIHDYNKKWSNIEDNEHDFIMKNWNNLEWLSNL